MRTVFSRIVTSLSLFVALMAGVVWFASERFTSRRGRDPSFTPGLLGLPYGEVTFPARDGLLMHAWLIPPPGSRAKGHIILLHGHSGILRADIEIAAALHQGGYEVLQLEMRGHGRSAGGAITFGVDERYDLLGALDFLAARGVKQVGVLGFSMGGAVALRTAAETDAAIRAIVTDGVYARLASVVAGWARDRNLPLESPSHLFGSLVLQVTERRLGIHLTESDPLRWVGRVSPRPIFFIQGEEDPFVPMSDFARLWRTAGEPKERWLVAGAGHRHANRLHPQEYGQRIVAFFDRWLADQVNGNGRDWEPLSSAEGIQR